MGISANQAKFLALTGRQCDLEYRMQNICQRRLNLSTKLTNAANAYNRQTSDRRLFINNIDSYTSSTGTVGDVTHGNLADNQQYEFITVGNLYDNGYYVIGEGGRLGLSRVWAVTGTEMVVTGTENDLTKPTAWAKKIEIQTIEHPAGYTTVVQTSRPDLKEPSSSADVIKSESLSAMTSVVGSTGLSDTDLKVVSYNTPVNGEMKTINSIAIRSQAGFDTIMAKMVAGDATALSQNYILDLNSDVPQLDMSSYANWAGISNFSGVFDGNFYTIANLGQSPSGAATNGLFNTVSGTIQNTYLDNVQIVTNQANAGGLVATLNGGNVLGCKITNLDMTINSSSSGAGGLVGSASAGAVIDRSIVEGTMALNGESHFGTGAFLGVGGDSTISRSYADVAIIVNDAMTITSASCISTFLGHDSNTALVEDCYSTSTAKRQNGSYLTVNEGGFSNTGFGDHSSKANTSWLLQNGTAVFWNDEGNVRYDENPNITPTIDRAAFEDRVITSDDGDIPIWLFQGDPGYYEQGQGTAASLGQPLLNMTAVNIVRTPAWTEQKEVEVDDLNNPIAWEQKNVYEEQDVYGWVDTYDETAADAVSSEELEAGLRSGKYRLAIDADMLSQNPVEMDGIMVQYVDWRTAPVINDDLYTTNDEAAEIIYEKTVTELNEQDKKLQLEQKKVETEYTAVTSQKEAVKKILDNNTQSSFKYFG